MAFDAFGPQRIGNASMLARGMEHRIIEDRARRILVAAEPAEDIADLVRRAQVDGDMILAREEARSEEHTSELQSLMRISYAVFCLKKKKKTNRNKDTSK